MQIVRRLQCVRSCQTGEQKIMAQCHVKSASSATGIRNRTKNDILKHPHSAIFLEIDQNSSYLINASGTVMI